MALKSVWTGAENRGQPGNDHVATRETVDMWWGKTKTGYCVAAELLGNNPNSVSNAYIWLSPALTDMLRKEFRVRDTF